MSVITLLQWFCLLKTNVRPQQTMIYYISANAVLSKCSSQILSNDSTLRDDSTLSLKGFLKWFLDTQNPLLATGFFTTENGFKAIRRLLTRNVWWRLLFCCIFCCRIVCLFPWLQHYLQPLRYDMPTLTSQFHSKNENSIRICRDMPFKQLAQVWCSAIETFR